MLIKLKIYFQSIISILRKALKMFQKTRYIYSRFVQILNKIILKIWNFQIILHRPNKSYKNVIKMKIKMNMNNWSMINRQVNINHLKWLKLFIRKKILNKFKVNTNHFMLLKIIYNNSIMNINKLWPLNIIEFLNKKLMIVKSRWYKNSPKLIY